VPIIDLPKRVASILQILKVDLLFSRYLFIFIQFWRRQKYFKFDICFKKKNDKQNREYIENSLIKDWPIIFTQLGKINKIQRYRIKQLSKYFIS